MIYNIYNLLIIVAYVKIELKLNMLIGAHGTNFDTIELIKESNFIESTASSDWLGNGAYFFVEGCSDKEPITLALDWARAQNWDNKKRRYKNKCIAGFEVKIICDETKILDLTTHHGKRLFNSYKESVKNTFKDKLKLESKKKLSDTNLLNSFKRNTGVEVVKADLYIKFEFERKNSIESRVANCTVIAVNNTQENIDITTIQNINKIELEV